ncbi:MAG: glycosyltransferase [Christensenellaceae bacterium]|nr:glycosyltransferase [Christensenellaceae bacterium]
METTKYNIPEKFNPGFSIVVPTKNRLHALENFMGSLEKQHPSDFLLIIVDQSETPINHFFYTNFLSIPILYCYAPELDGLTAARNASLKHIQGEYTFMFDDDIILTDNCIIDVLNKMEKYPEIVAISTNIQARIPDSKIKASMKNFTKKGAFSIKRKDLPKSQIELYTKDNLIATYKISGCTTCFRSVIFKEFSFSDELYSYCLGEDYDFSYRISKKYIVARCISISVIHNHDTTGRFNYEKDYDSRICFYKWFYDKNVDKTVSNRFSYMLLILGVYIDAIIKSIRLFNLAPLKGVRKGKKKIKTGFVGAYCIKHKKEPI